MVGLLRGALCVWAATVGSVVGAGFASGEEVLAFFAAGGVPSFGAALSAGVLIALLGGRLMLLAQSLPASSCSAVLRLLFGSYARYGAALLAVFWLVSLAVMLAGAGALLASHVPPASASVCLALVLLALSRRGARAVLRANLVITPLVLVMLAGAASYSLVYHRASLSALFLPAAMHVPSADALLGCLVYVSYDLVLCLPALVSLPAFSRGAVRGGAVLSGITLSVLLTALAAVVSLHYEEALTARLPMLRVAGMQADACLALYTAVLMLAVVTSASSALLGLSRVLSPYVRPPLVRDAAVLLLALVIGQAGFSVLIESVVPALGALSLVFMLRLCLPVRGGTRLR